MRLPSGTCVYTTASLLSTFQLPSLLSPITSRQPPRLRPNPGALDPGTAATEAQVQRTYSHSEFRPWVMTPVNRVRRLASTSIHWWRSFLPAHHAPSKKSFSWIPACKEREVFFRKTRNWWKLRYWFCFYFMRLRRGEGGRKWGRGEKKPLCPELLVLNHEGQLLTIKS